MIVAVDPKTKTEMQISDDLADEYTTTKTSIGPYEAYDVIRHSKGESWKVGRCFTLVTGEWSGATTHGRPRSTFATMEDARNWVIGSNLTLRRKHFHENI